MVSAASELNIRPDFDKEIVEIANYVIDYQVTSELAYETAYYCLLDTLGCGLLALNYPECCKLLGPIVDGTKVPNGARVLGTDFVLDPVLAAFNIGAMIRWLDFNDTWLAAEWGHPSDNLGGILAIADYLSRRGEPLLVKDVLTSMIKAHEIQGCLALENAFNQVGLDHVVLVKVATVAVVTQLLGGSFEQICNAISLAWVDGQSLRTYRHAPNTGTRKSWAAGDATARGVFLALMVLKGEMGYPSALTASKWGFYDVHFKGKSFVFQRSYGSYVMENILFKIAFPAEFHAQTAAEAAIQLHTEVRDRLNDIERITIRTQESANRIINKRGELYNEADRDHCLQYIVAVGLIFGNITSDHYQDTLAHDSRIDYLRNKMEVVEEEQFSKDYLDPSKRSIANAVKIYFKDGSSTHEVIVEYPLGHKRRRREGIPLLKQKFKRNISSRFDKNQVDRVLTICHDQAMLEAMPVNHFVELFLIQHLVKSC